MASGSFHPAVPLERLTRLLPVPLNALEGHRAPDLALPDNLVCFYHHSFKQMNLPPEGRALHHRYVLILALETAATVCVDDRAIRLHAGEGLLVLPFQFHNYIMPERDDITWLFVTFEMADGRALEPLRFHSFSLSPILRQLLTDMIRAYLSPGQAELALLTFALLLVRIRQSDRLRHDPQPISAVPALVIQINQLAQGPGKMPSVEEMASHIGISPSHLRARFRASCGVSLGRHLRKLRMEKACSLLRLSSRRVSEIAEQCGFTSIFSFSRSFRKTFGVSPVAYRRKGVAASIRNEGRRKVVEA
jgi:AraC-like DNA-binding protein